MRQGLVRHWTANIATCPTTDGEEATSFAMLIISYPEVKQVGIGMAGMYQVGQRQRLDRLLLGRPKSR